MVPCPACNQVAFQAGVCRSCGFRVVAGQRDAPVQPAPMELPMDAIVEVLDPAAIVEVDDGPSLLDFESTALVEDSPPTAAPIRELQSCPRCRVALPSPMPNLCDGCGFRLRPRTRKVEVAADDGTRPCRECGISNPVDRSNCLNCGSRMNI